MDSGHDPLDRIIRGDRGAFASETARGVPGMRETARMIHPHARRPRTVRRFVLAGAAAALAAVLMLLVPVSYPAMVGGTVSLAIDGEMTPAARSEIGRGLAAGLGSGAVIEDSGRAGTAVVTARARGSLREIRAAAASFATGLRDRGLTVTVSVAPWVEGRTGNATAFASDRIRTWWIELRGRSSAEIEAELRERLEEAGFSDRAVTVRREGGRITIDVRARDDRGRLLETQTTRDATEGAADAPMGVDLELPDLEDLDRLPIEARREAVEKRLREHGIEARVTIVDGALHIERNETIERKR